MIAFLMALAAFGTSVISGVAGFGGALLFLPALISVYGARSSVPILTVAVLLGNASRVYFNRGDLNLKLVGLFSLGAIPFAVLGSYVYVLLPALWIKRIIGVFLVASVAYQKLVCPIRIRHSWIFTPLGAASGFLSAIIGGIGPFSSPFFLAYGLTKEAFVGTEAFCAATMHLTKSLAYRRFQVLGSEELKIGLTLGGAMILGSYAAKKILKKLSREKFLVLVETLLVLVGALMIFGM